jgi:repressor of nif and glnA expression
MVGLLDKEIQNRNSKISTRITKAHKSCLEGKGLIRRTWCEIELTPERFRTSDSLDQKRH